MLLPPMVAVGVVWVSIGVLGFGAGSRFGVGCQDDDDDDADERRRGIENARRAEDL